MAKNSAAKIAANNRYAAKTYERVSFVVKKGQREVIKAHAASKGESVNAFLQRAVALAIEQDTKSAE